MTHEQFIALAALRGMQSGASRECMRLVFVEGLTPSEAARRTGITRQAANKALQAARQTIEHARVFCGLPPAEPSEQAAEWLERNP